MEPKTLTEILGSSSKSSLFSGTPFKIAKPVNEEIQKPPEESSENHEKAEKSLKNKEKDLELTKIEEKKVVFVGNVSLDCKKSHIKRLMTSIGPVEKVWRRSIPLDRGKLPVVAAVALKKYKSSNETCNFYVLFTNEEDAKKSLELNGQEYKGTHLRVDLAYNPEKNTDNSIFLGNLPFDVKEEELWEEFQEFGSIKYVRVVRNPTTFQGKGIAFVCFNEKKPAKRAISKNNTVFKGRRIRVAKAVESGTEVKTENKRPSFGNVKGFKKQSEILEEAPLMKPRHPSTLKGTKKDVRKEQIKLQNKRKLRKEMNTKNMKKKKKT